MSENQVAPIALTPEQIEFAQRLQSIFMPYAHRQVERVYQNPNRPVRFVHYTSAAAALSIIRTKRVWARNTNCMADYREVAHGFDMLNSYFLDEANRNSFIQVLDLASPGVAQEAINLFNGWLNDLRLNTYIASLSEHDDHEDPYGRLSMWRAFGGANVARVAIVIRVPRFSNGGLVLSLLFSPVAYMGEAQVHAELTSVVESIRREVQFLRTVERQVLIATMFNMLIAGSTCLKHQGFSEEREWRAVYSPTRWPSALVEVSTEVFAGVPQPVYKIPLDANLSAELNDLDFARIFDRLIIGPSPYPWVMYRAFAEALRAAGVADADHRVFTSNIPIRG